MQKTQWLMDDPLLTYRCGGSAGFGSRGLTGFPFNQSRVKSTGTSKQAATIAVYVNNARFLLWHPWFFKSWLKSLPESSAVQPDENVCHLPPAASSPANRHHTHKRQRQQPQHRQHMISTLQRMIKTALPVVQGDDPGGIEVYSGNVFSLMCGSGNLDSVGVNCDGSEQIYYANALP